MRPDTKPEPICDLGDTAISNIDGHDGPPPQGASYCVRITGVEILQ